MSRRFKNRHAKAKADPNAKPTPPVVLDDENSYADPLQPDRRIPKVLNGRAYVQASALADQEKYEARQRAIAKASKASNGDSGATG